VDRIISLNSLQKLIVSEEGTALIEYSLVASILTVVAIASLQFTGETIAGFIDQASSSLR
jgi:Flp pilus assembly pilin Flp